MAFIVSAPADLVVAAGGDIEVCFAGFDLVADLPAPVPAPPGTRGVRVMVGGVRGARAKQRDSGFHAARLAWYQRRQSGESPAEESVPAMPGVLVLDRVGVLLRDDLGTECRSVAGRIGGDGTEGEGSWTYLPQPPDAARTLRLGFTLDGEPTGKDCEIRIRSERPDGVRVPAVHGDGRRRTCWPSVKHYGAGEAGAEPGRGRHGRPHPDGIDGPHRHGCPGPRGAGIW